MLLEEDIAKNTEALFKAVVRIGGRTISSMVVHAHIPISLKKGETKVLDRKSMHVRFIYDTNHPKVFVDDFDEMDFHTEFSVSWQKFRYREEEKILVIKGMSTRVPQGYALRFHLKGIKATRDA